jgi:TolB-like protein
VRLVVEVRRLTYSSNPYWTMFLPLPGLGWIIGLPMLSLRSEAVVAIRVRQGTTIVGEYQGTGTEHRFMSIYYGRDRQPSDGSGGGVVAAALERAMEDAKVKVAKDRAAVAAAAGGGTGAPAHEGHTVAVAELEANGVPGTDAAVLANMLRGELVQTGAFRVVEKANMDKVLAEQAFQQTGCTSQECAVKLGKVLNVQRMIVGSFGKLLGRYILNVRVVSVESGEVVQAEEARGDTIDQLEASLKALAARLAASPR